MTQSVKFFHYSSSVPCFSDRLKPLGCSKINELSSNLIMISIIYSDEFLDHDTGIYHPEKAARLTAIFDDFTNIYSIRVIERYRWLRVDKSKPSIIIPVLVKILIHSLVIPALIVESSIIPALVSRRSIIIVLTLP